MPQNFTPRPVSAAAMVNWIGVDGVPANLTPYPIGTILVDYTDGFHAYQVTADQAAPLPIPFGKRAITSNYWTTKLSPTAPIAPTSAAIVSRLVALFSATIGGQPLDAYYGAPYNSDVSTGAYSIPVYELPLDTPRVPVWSRSDKYYTEAGVRVNLRDTLNAGVPIPDLARLRANADGSAGTIQPAGTDGAVIFICGNEAWELWRFAPAVVGTDPDGYDWKCQQGGYIADIRYHPGWWKGSSTSGGGDFGVSGSGGSYLGPMLTVRDWEDTEIRHPLSLSVPNTGGVAPDPDRWLPATRNDKLGGFRSSSTNPNNYRVQEGTRFRLPVDKWTDDYITTYANAKGKVTAGRPGATAAVLAKVLRAIRDYGIIVTDFAGILGFSAEATKTVGTPYSPASTPPLWGNFGQQLPWAEFVQISPPMISTAVGGAGPTEPVPDAYDYSRASG